MLPLCGLVLLLAGNLKLASSQQFSCEGRPSGYYADLNSGCQVYHMCDGLGRQFSYTCPNATLFQQRMLVCDHWYMVNCSRSETDYRANLLIGQKDKPFVEDSERQRTPRPDLLSHPSEPQYSRDGRAFSPGNINKLVGVETEPDRENDTFGSDKPLYFVPSHWSTEYSRETATQVSIVSLNPNFAGVKEKPRGFSKTTASSKQDVKKKKLGSPTNKPKAFGIESLGSPTNKPKGFGGETLGLVNLVNQNKDVKEKLPVNFPSNFENTTPKFPTFVDDDSKRFEVEEGADFENKNVSNINKFLEPPPLVKNNATRNIKSSGNVTSTVKVKKQNVQHYSWQDLRKKFLIPDVVLPLDTMKRPGYDEAPNSFQVKFEPVYITNDTKS